MISAEGSLPLPARKRLPLATLAGAWSSPRFWIYLSCVALAVVASCLLGKDMNWDTLDYHFYAGFSALHDRFNTDYFAAGSQSYFNPYVYVPFYLLARSRLPAVVDASILAVVQSGILWLTFELAWQVAPAQGRVARYVIAICSALFASANPILLNLFGSSYADVTTAELVLAGWLLLVMAVRAPRIGYVVAAAVLLGIASALKLTNSVHALSAAALVVFLPVRPAVRARYAAAYLAALGVSFVLICLPWSIRLEQHFGNPLFPLANEIFRSPQFPTAPMLDYRFVPDSVAEALWRPFAIAKPEFMVDDELQSPDIRYAVLLLAAAFMPLGWAWRRSRRAGAAACANRPSLGAATRPLGALAAGFGIDWTLWLMASGNGRYFIAMACIAGVLGIVLLWHLFTAPRLRGYLLAAVLGAQVAQLGMGTTYRAHLPWHGRPWFEVQLPAGLPRTPSLFLSYGVQSNAFIVPFLPPGSGFINIGGDYPLAAHGANGAAVAGLIRKYWPHVRILARDGRPENSRLPQISGITAAADALLPFELRPTGSDCSTITVPDEGRQDLMFVHTQVLGSATAAPAVPDREVPESTTSYLTTCPVVAYPDARALLMRGKQEAEQALDRLEDACPKIFQPKRALMQYYGDPHQVIWARRYLNTSLTAWETRGWVWFIDPLRGGPAQYIGPAAGFEHRGARIVCGRSHERYYAKLVLPPAPGSSP